MGSLNTEGSEGLREIGFDPVGEMLRGLSLSDDELLNSTLGLARVIGVEDAGRTRNYKQSDALA